MVTAIRYLSSNKMVGKLSFVFGPLVEYLQKDLEYTATLAGGLGRFADKDNLELGGSGGSEGGKSATSSIRAAEAKLQKRRAQSVGSAAAVDPISSRRC